jgi:outer membrane protein OmpA-like peptidoglycan-associated protein/YHS domain-containing protein
VSLPKAINTKYHESSASFSYDGKTIYFDSNRKDDNFGEHDIFRYTRDEEGNLTKAENLGPVINTKYDERSPFIHPDGRTLYFSSKGHNSMGGFDIFRSVYNDSTGWSEPENLGFPINTPDDDIFFVLSANGRHGYYSSAKEGGFGEQDIYRITFLGAEKPVVLSNEDNLLAALANPLRDTKMENPVPINNVNLTLLKGTIIDGATNKPAEATIEVTDNEKNKLVSTSKSNSSSGRYVILLPSGKNYGLAIRNAECVFHSENYDVPQASGYQEFDNDITLPKYDIGSKIILRNIFFGSNKATVTPESYPELSRLVLLLKKCTDMRIEISGHTDSIGTLKENLALSEERAKNVVEYLIEQGIGASRLEYKGVAFSEPVASNATEDGRKKNRRVEFKILSK